MESTNYNGFIMWFNSTSQKWDFVGEKKSKATLNFVKSPTECCFKLIGKRNSDNSVILTTNLNPDTKTKLATDTFINFKDGDTSYGIKFSKPDIAALFQQTIENLKLPSTPNEVKNFSSSAPPLPPPLISRVSSNLPSTILPPPLTASEPPQTHGSCDITPPPPPPPPPPCSAASTSEVRGMESAPKKDDRINSGMDLSSALSAVKLRKPPAAPGKSIEAESKPPASSEGGGVMSEMAALLEKRKKRQESADQPKEKVFSLSSKQDPSNLIPKRETNPSFKQEVSKVSTTFFHEKKQHLSTVKKPQVNTEGHQSVGSIAGNTELENVKKDIMEFIIFQLTKVKEEIINEIRNTRN